MKIKILKKFQPLYKPKRTKIYFGGRGGLKSWEFARYLALKAASSKRRVLCTRQTQASISDSVIKLMADTAKRLNLDGFYDVQKNAIIGDNGSDFLFKGLWNNDNGIRSTHNVMHCWAEEASDVLEGSWRGLLPTIRTPGSEILVSFNPRYEDDYTYTRFVVPYLEEIEKNGFYEDDDIVVVKTSWRDNPWFKDSPLYADMLADRERDYKEYLHVWEGQPLADYEDAIIEPEWFDACVDAHKKLGIPDQGGNRVVGFDVADKGSDSKALVSRIGSVVTDIKKWDHGDLNDGIALAYDQALNHKASWIVYDEVGVGAGVNPILKRHIGDDDISINGFAGSGSVTEPKKIYKGGRNNKEVFYNIRAQKIWDIRERMINTYNAVVKGQYIDPATMLIIDGSCSYIQELKQECIQIRRKRYKGDKILIESKQEMKKRGVSSPNLFDALYMSFAERPKVQIVTDLNFASVF